MFYLTKDRFYIHPTLRPKSYPFFRFKILLNDILVFYQHRTNRNGQEWIDPKRIQFEDALGLPHGNAKIAHGAKIANDVVFFYSRKEVRQ